MIYVIISFNPAVNYVIQLYNKELSSVSYMKFDTLVSYDPNSIFIYVVHIMRQVNISAHSISQFVFSAAQVWVEFSSP